MTRFPLEPLVAVIGTREPWLQVGVSRRVWQRAAVRGWLSTCQADRYAIHAGSHPAVIWPREWLGLEVEDDKHARQVA